LLRLPQYVQAKLGLAKHESLRWLSLLQVVYVARLAKAVSAPYVLHVLALAPARAAFVARVGAHSELTLLCWLVTIRRSAKRFA
jgi:hypothetical protein